MLDSDIFVIRTYMFVGRICYLFKNERAFGSEVRFRLEILSGKQAEASMFSLNKKSVK